MGFINPALYQNPAVLNDIVNGTNPGCGTQGFSCAQGWVGYKRSSQSECIDTDRLSSGPGEWSWYPFIPENAGVLPEPTLEDSAMAKMSTLVTSHGLETIQNGYLRERHVTYSHLEQTMLYFSAYCEPIDAKSRQGKSELQWIKRYTAVTLVHSIRNIQHSHFFARTNG